MKDIVIKGAREHNLKNIDLVVPRDKLVVFTGLSGSGKSSLAFDTIYAEGQRRYVESLSSYARMFLGQMEKPDLDSIDGLSPAISIDQKSTSNNPRSTVGTVTEIHDYLRLLYARCGVPHCPKCGKVIERQSIDQVVDRVLSLPEGTRIQVMAPCVRGRKGEHQKVLDELRREGYARARVDGTVYDLSEVPALDKKFKHSIEAVIDRLVIKRDIGGRLTDSLENAFRLGKNLAIVQVVDGEELLFSQNYACADCGIDMEELTPRMFSFNNPFGACPSCSGLGTLKKIDPALLVPNPALSLAQGAIDVMGWNSGSRGTIAAMYFQALCDHYGVSMDTPYRELPERVQQAILYGTGAEKLHIHYQKEFGNGTFDAPFEGIAVNMERRHQETSSDYSRQEIEQYMSETPCPVCRGRRLKRESLAVTVGGKDIAALSDMPVRSIREFLAALTLTPTQQMIAAQILKEIDARLGFLINVGLDYLTLSRAAATLSGGEAQRVKLATELSRKATGRTLYILDEPTTGLHMDDVARLNRILSRLADAGNTLVVIEHNLDVIKIADHLIDLGPEGGDRGGRIVACGTPEELCQVPESYTGRYLKPALERAKREA